MAFHNYRVAEYPHGLEVRPGALVYGYTGFCAGLGLLGTAWISPAMLELGHIVGPVLAALPPLFVLLAVPIFLSSWTHVRIDVDARVVCACRLVLRARVRFVERTAATVSFAAVQELKVVHRFQMNGTDSMRWYELTVVTRDGQGIPIATSDRPSQLQTDARRIAGAIGAQVTI